MGAIRDRILARCAAGDQAVITARANRNLDDLAALLNEECVPVDVPTQITASFILDIAPSSQVLFQLLRDAAAGESVQERAAALLSPEGLTVMAPGFEPPQIDRMDVSYGMFNPDGSELTE